jgi:hypothetical protein
MLNSIRYSEEIREEVLGRVTVPEKESVQKLLKKKRLTKQQSIIGLKKLQHMKE